MIKNTFSEIVLEDFNNFRIDKFLQIKLNFLSRTRIQSLILDKYVKLNKMVVDYPSKKIKKNDKIVVNIPPSKETFIKANKIPLDILYDDKDIIIINKLA